MLRQAHAPWFARAARVIVGWWLGCWVVTGLVATAAAQSRIILPREQVVRQVFRESPSLEAARREAEQKLMVAIDQIVASCQATEEQRRKLELAGWGDIHRYFADFEAFLRRHAFGNMTREAFEEMMPEMKELSRRYQAGLHSEHSLFAKTLPVVLDPTQHLAWTKSVRDRQTQRYSDRVLAAVMLIDRRVPMTETQRRALVRYVVANSKPPPIEGESMLYLYAVLIRIGQLPERDLAALFTPDEWLVVSDILAHARSMEMMIERQLGARALP